MIPCQRVFLSLSATLSSPLTISEIIDYLLTTVDKNGLEVEYHFFMNIHKKVILEVEYHFFMNIHKLDFDFGIPDPHPMDFTRCLHIKRDIRKSVEDET